MPKWAGKSRLSQALQVVDETLPIYERIQARFPISDEGKKIYRGYWQKGYLPTVNGIPLTIPKQDDARLFGGAGGFRWGYPGTGPNRLAYAILFDYYNDVAKAERLYMSFRKRVVSKRSVLAVVSVLGFYGVELSVHIKLCGHLFRTDR
jgi:Family of unknown function (DUF6166)